MSVVPALRPAPPRRSFRPLLAFLVALLPLVAAIVGGGVHAQDAPVTALRVGWVLPPEDAADPLTAAVARAARQGLTMAEDEFSVNAMILGLSLDFVTESAVDGAEATAAAERLVDAEGIALLVGGYGAEQARALAEVAAARGLPFLNVGSPDATLRGAECRATSFHLEPSAAMYLDALAGWYVRAGFRNWLFVTADDPSGAALQERLSWTLRERHFGARVVARETVDPAAADVADALTAIERRTPDVVVLLLAPTAQLAFLEAYAAAGLERLETRLTGFPWPASQTRAFFEASVAAAPEAGAGFRATAWEPTLDAYGARELNARYLQRFGEPMDPPAWASYQVVKMLFEAASLGGAGDAAALIDYFASPDSVFDLWKGIGVSFRPWDHQLRQPLYLVSVRAADTARERALLVGELPAIYLPRTDPLERLDQLGDLERRSECDF